MGISENAASRGLYHTGNTSPDLAATWVFDHIEDPDLHEPFHPSPLPPLSPPSLPLEARSLKMVFVVNTSIGMGVGKIASQVAHATLALYKTLLLVPAEQRTVEEWEGGGAKKIVLKGRDAEHLMELREEARKRSVPFFVISDAGERVFEFEFVILSLSLSLFSSIFPSSFSHISLPFPSSSGKTQVEPGSVTVLALFGRNYLVDEITGQLSLL